MSAAAKKTAAKKAAPTKPSASAEFRRRLLAGEAIRTTDFIREQRTNPSTVHSAANNLRQKGLRVLNSNGVYRLDAVERSAGEALAKAAIAAGKQDHPALGATLRVVRIELVSRGRVATTLDDGEVEWFGLLARRSAESDESAGSVDGG